MRFEQWTTRAAVVILVVVATVALAAPAAFARSWSVDAPAVASEPAAPVSAAGSLPQLLPRASAVSPILLSQGFENGLSGWLVSGSPTWGITTHRAAAGLNSAYCAQSTIPAPGPYVDYMYAWLKAGPFDLTKVSAASLSYKLYLKSELDIDTLKCLVSLDGSNYYGWATSGDTLGWSDRTRNLAAVNTIGSVCGKSRVYIAFVFESDDSIIDEGAYVDEITLTDVSPPSVTSLAPASGNVGSTVTLTGAGYAGVTAVAFNGAAAQFTIGSSTQITATVPSGATTGAVTVTSPNGVGTSTGNFTVTVPPTITSVTPGKGAVGTFVTVQGAHFEDITKVTFAGVPAPYHFDTSTQITTVVPAGAQTGLIEVTTAGGVGASATSFVVDVRPGLSRVSPTAGKRGATVTLTGRDFGAVRLSGYVKFGTVKCTRFVSWSPTRIKCKVPAKARFGKLKVVVVTPGGASAARTFTVKR